MIKFRFTFLLLVVLAFSCKQEAKNSSDRLDPHSYSEPNLAVVKHLDLTIKVDFENEQIVGKAVWRIANPSSAEEIIFDNNVLNITKVTLGSKEESADYKLGQPDSVLGTALHVKIKKDTRIVNIYYNTSKGAPALQWLNAQQTAGKVHPYLFTQSQSIAARSWVPCQDSPAIRFTYNATVTVPKELIALMSAVNPKKKNNTGIYTFKQTHPIPSYLLALAVGDISFKSIDGRTGVYAEPSELNKAVFEFADMGTMVTEAEKLYGPYRWGRYDILVLPPSFPFGGMENPNLSFITPTIIAGDRSLVNIICHELAHSWSGNLVTNATWNDFWLNEGFTNYFERRLVDVLYGTEEAEMQEELARVTLDEAVNDMKDRYQDTRLKTDYKGRNPDDATNDIAYEKGYFFLRMLEHEFGRAKLDDFLKKYFSSYAFKSVSTEDFLVYLDKNLIKGDEELSKKLRIKDWVYGGGIPSNIVFASRVWGERGKFYKIDYVLKGWLNGTIKDYTLLPQLAVSSTEQKFMLGRLPAEITVDQMKVLDKLFDFTGSGNTDLQRAWFLLAIQKGYSDADAEIKSYLIKNGRMWHIIPLYKELIKTEAGRQKALAIYKMARPNYHPMTYTAIDKFLK